jgi:hypothetical protein
MHRLHFPEGLDVLPLLLGQRTVCGLRAISPQCLLQLHTQSTFLAASLLEARNRETFLAVLSRDSCVAWKVTNSQWGPHA